MRATLQAIHNHPKFRLVLIVTGTHLSRKFGNTIHLILKDGFPIGARIRIPDRTSPRDVARNLGKLVGKIAAILQRIDPDLVLLEGDRYETLACAIAAAYMNVPIAHVSGGDVSGSIDDAARHAITKFANLHFPGTRRSAERIKKMGEEPWRVAMVGTVGADERVPSASLARRVAAELGLRVNRPIILVSQHPVPAEEKQARAQMECTMRALIQLKHQTLVFYPNQDAGADDIISVINRYRHLPFIHVIKSLPREEFLALMRIATVMVGNSSAGIVEAPSFKLSAVNIGTRQQGRERAANVVDVAYNTAAIKRAIRIVMNPAFRRKLSHMSNPYRGRKTPQRIAHILATTSLDMRLLHKRFTY